MTKIKSKFSQNPIRSWCIHQSLDYPWRTIIISLLVTLLVGSGVKFFLIDDDMMKILPKNLESRISWEAIQDEFGSTEVIFIAFGNEGESIFNPEAIATLWDLTEALETGKQIEELNSIATATRMDNLDGFMEVDDLQPERNLSQEEPTKCPWSRHGIYGDWIIIICYDWCHGMDLSINRF